MQLISSAVVGSGGAASMSFTSIPQTFTDLVLVVSARHNTTGVDNTIAQLNGTTSGYTFRYIGSTGSAIQNFTQANIGFSSGMPCGNIGGTSYTANTFNIGSLYLLNYTDANAKRGVSEGAFENNDSATAYMSFTSSTSTVTAAVTSITIKPAFTSFVEHSTAYLYGILKGSGGATVS
jgi:hypothetical protein